MDAPLGRVYGNEAHRLAREAAEAAQVEAAAAKAEAARVEFLTMLTLLAKEYGEESSDEED